MTATMLSIQALSPIHVGMGQGAGVIDLPVIREAVTGWPYLPGSSIKGVLRDACENAGVSKERITVVFGPETDNASDHAGGIIVADQRLLCLPVRSYIGGFAWVTSPLAVNRWLRDLKVIGVTLEGVSPLALPAQPHSIHLPSPTSIALMVKKSGEGKDIDMPSKVHLEDLKLTPVNGALNGKLVDAIAAKTVAEDWRDFFKTHFGVVSDTTFGFLARTAMEVTARNSIDAEKKTVKDGALWWEESVPAETIFAGPITLTPQGIKRMAGMDGVNDGAVAIREVLETGMRGTIQIGGNATVGRGLAIARFDRNGGEQ